MQQNPYLQIEKHLFKNAIYHLFLLLLDVLEEEGILWNIVEHMFCTGALWAIITKLAIDQKLLLNSIKILYIM